MSLEVVFLRIFSIISRLTGNIYAITVFFFFFTIGFVKNSTELFFLILLLHPFLNVANFSKHSGNFVVFVSFRVELIGTATQKYRKSIGTYFFWILLFLSDFDGNHRISQIRSQEII